MQQDAQGNAISTAGANAARAFDHTIAGYLDYRSDTASACRRCWRPTRIAAWRMR